MNAGRRMAGISLAGLLIVGGGGLLRAGGTLTVTQQHRAFSLAELSMRRGDTLRFTNDDLFNHQVYVKSPAFSFESPEQAPGETVEVAFPKPGVFEVLCGIHPRMHLNVTVQ